MARAASAPCKEVGQTADVDFRVLGSVGIVDGTALLPLGGGMPRRLLAVLLAYRNSVVSTDRLVEVLWEDPPETAAATLQSYVSRLRRFVELDDGAIAREPGPRLRAGGARHRRRRRALRGRAGRRPRPARRATRSPPSTVSTPPSASGGATPSPSSPRPSGSGPKRCGSRSCGWSRPRPASTRELRVGRHHEVVERGRRPARRAPAARAVRPSGDARAATAPAGRPRRCGSRSSSAPRCATTSGSSRRPQLRDLETAILEEREELAWVAPAWRLPTSDRGRAGRAPRCRSETTALVGRERDLELAGRLLATGRILTLFGPGGVGKTRLAQRLASTIADQFVDGVRLVELAPVRDEGAVTAAFAAALDVQQRPNRSLERVDRRAARGRSRCCSCSTTASTCSTPPASSSSRSCSGAPTCRCSPPVGSRSGSPPRWCGRCHRCRCRPSADLPLEELAVGARGAAVRRARPVRAARLRARRRQPRAPSPSCASASTACRSRSSSPPRGCGR